MLNLDKVTLFCIDYKQPDLAIRAIETCKHYAQFSSIRFITNTDVHYEHATYESYPINSLADYSRFILLELPKYVETEYVLTTHHDGFICSPDAWTDEFYDYDYIGATWYAPDGKPMPNPVNPVGNGGFSLRSKRLINLVSDFVIKNPTFPYHPHEDIVVTQQLKGYLEHMGCKFASVEIADKFSVETKGVWSPATFGFHNYKFVNPEKFGWIDPLKEKT